MVVKAASIQGKNTRSNKLAKPSSALLERTARFSPSREDSVNSGSTHIDTVGREAKIASTTKHSEVVPVLVHKTSARNLSTASKRATESRSHAPNRASIGEDDISVNTDFTDGSMRILSKLKDLRAGRVQEIPAPASATPSSNDPTEILKSKILHLHATRKKTPVLSSNTERKGEGANTVVSLVCTTANDCHIVAKELSHAKCSKDQQDLEAQDCPSTPLTNARLSRGRSRSFDGGKPQQFPAPVRSGRRRGKSCDRDTLQILPPRAGRRLRGNSVDGDSKMPPQPRGSSVDQELSTIWAAKEQNLSGAGRDHHVERPGKLRRSRSNDIGDSEQIRTRAVSPPRVIRLYDTTPISPLP